MIFRTILSIATLLSSTSAFSTTTGGGVARHSTTSSFSYSTSSSSSALQAAESEVAFGDLDGSELRIGVLRTRWNDEHVSNLVEGIKVSFFLFIILLYFCDVINNCIVVVMSVLVMITIWCLLVLPFEDCTLFLFIAIN